jgi:hypothetical protein
MNNPMKFKIMNFQMDASTCFMHLSSFVPKGTKKLLMVTPHMTPWDMGIYQEWNLMFNLDFPLGLKNLFWCSLKVLSFEYRPVENTISACVGKIMGEDPNNQKRWDFRFCIMINPWVGFDYKHCGVSGKEVEVVVNFLKISYQMPLLW